MLSSLSILRELKVVTQQGFLVSQRLTVCDCQAAGVLFVGILHSDTRPMDSRVCFGATRTASCKYALEIGNLCTLDKAVCIYSTLLGFRRP